MAAIDVLDFGIHAAPGQGNAVWNAVINGRDRDEYRTGFELFDLAESAADRALGDHQSQVEALFLGSSSDSYAERETAHVQKPDLAKELALTLGIERHFQFANACASSSSAIVAAMDAINSGQFDVVLAGGADTVTASSVAGFKAVRIYGDKCRPFDVNRKGLVLSDGAAFLLLARKGIGTPPLAKLTGAGMVSGADEMAGMTGDGPYRALVAARESANDPPIGFIIAHGTGTKVNDEAESDAIAQYFGAMFPPIASYKRWLGHPQGASGAIGVVLAIEAMNRGEMFPTTYAIDQTLKIARNVTESHFTHDMKTAAVLSHGTWGVYTALVVEGRYS